MLFTYAFGTKHHGRSIDRACTVTDTFVFRLDIIVTLQSRETTAYMCTIVHNVHMTYSRYAHISISTARTCIAYMQSFTYIHCV